MVMASGAQWHGEHGRAILRSALLDYAASRAGKDEGMDRGMRGANPEFKRFFYGCIIHVAMRRRTFVADHWWVRYEELGRPRKTHDYRVIGGIIQRAAKHGVCFKMETKADESSRPNMHNSFLSVWTSRIFGRFDLVFDYDKGLIPPDGEW
jgi:hypothetical protein